VTNRLGSITSNSANLRMLTTTPVIRTQPISTAAPVGGTVTFAVEAESSQALRYQWRRNGAAIAGATSAQLTLSKLVLANAAAYTVAVTGGSTVVSQTAQLGVWEHKPGRFPLGLAARVGLKLNAAGNNLSFVWKKDDNVMSADPRRVLSNFGKTLTISQLQSEDSGDYVCHLTDAAGVVHATAPQSLEIFTLAPEHDEAEDIPVGYIGTAFSWKVPVVDGDERSPSSYTASGLPTGLVINAGTGYITGRPKVTRATPYPITLTVKNTKGSDVRVVQLSILPVPTSFVGTWQGLIPPDHPEAARLGGSIKLIVTAAGSATGTLVLGKTSYPLTLPLDVDSGSEIGSALANVTRKAPALPLLVTATLEGGTVSVELSAGSLPPAPVVPLTFCPWSTKALAPLTLVGAFNNTFTPQEPAELEPTGHSYFILTTTAAGTASWRGYAADGTAVTGSALLGADSTVPLHTLLYLTTGSLHGQLTVGGDGGVSGNLRWFKGFQTAATRSYRAGFEISVENVGGRYSKPVGTGPILGADPTQSINGYVGFGGIWDEVVFDVRLTNRTFYFPLQGISCTVNPATGEMTGVINIGYPDPIDMFLQSVVPTSYRALIVQQPGTQSAVGFFNAPRAPIDPGETTRNTPMLSGSVAVGANAAF
jgi:hypothetical protein